MKMLRNVSIKENLCEVGKKAIESEKPVIDQLKAFLLKMDQEHHELWQDRANANETKDELR